MSPNEPSASIDLILVAIKALDENVLSGSIVFQFLKYAILESTRFWKTYFFVDNKVYVPFTFFLLL